MSGPIEARAERLFAQGLEWHRQGALGEALAAYEQALQLQPGYAEVLHHIGILAYQTGDYATAEQFQYAALEIDGGAVAVWNALGNVLKACGRHEAALAAYAQALAIDQEYTDAHYNCGNTLLALGRHEEALAGYDRALALDPGLVQAWNNRAVALQQLGLLAEALASIDAVLGLQPGHAEAHNNRGNLLMRQRRKEAALESFERALACRPDYADALVNRARALDEMGRFDAALESLDAALKLQPEHAEAHNNRGNLLLRLRRHEAALDSFARALACRPDYADAYVNRAKLFKDLGRLDAAQADLEHAIGLDPELAAAHWNLGLLALLRGRLAQGWQGNEWRWKVDQLMQDGELQRFEQPLWLGEQDPAGKTILLWAEQGLGDTIQMARYAGLLAARGAGVILEVQPALMGLLSGSLTGSQSSFTARVLARGEALPDFDFHCPMMSLPLAFGTELATIPAAPSYLRAAPERIAQWNTLLGPAARVRAGLAWSGNPDHTNDHHRSIAFAEFAQALTPACEFVSLQKEVRASDATALAAGAVRDFGAQLHDFGDTAALCAVMDVVVTVDTSIAHLAGALGKPVWILLPYAPDWRWLLERGDSPWYPGARLVRQGYGEDWSAVLARVRADLDALAGGPR
ncbi:tetratricopeptide repeat protein [Massilia sp. 2TAF26]|uniref:tetratricopeptide repeat protein n=1 Tax=Massilia sp. 2TAF26 TaxID=3233012 RepID=UPI003F9E5AD6